MNDDLAVNAAGDTLSFRGAAFPCVIGRGGILPSDRKREGDGATPAGRWPLLTALIRPDRNAAPRTALPWRWLRPDDGWSDDPRDPAYNRPVCHPHGFSAERLWRDDSIYDIIIVLGHNMNPPVPGQGSAIFLHMTRPDLRPTEGCVALPPRILRDMLPHLAPGMAITIHAP